jgi:putative ATP-dependent endonuclease of OLD family
VIEFAQSGLKPLIKFARRMGIEWHVLVDGDEAGKKYASTVRSLLNNEREEERDHLTMLPAMDMEHFMYRQGFDDVFHRIAMVPVDVPMNMRRVIAKAIHRSSKPDLAIEVATEAGSGAWRRCRPCCGRCSPACCGWHAGERINWSRLFYPSGCPAA